MDGVRYFTTEFLKLTVPNQYVLLIAGGVAWYGKQLTLAFAHDWARKIVVEKTIKVVGSERIGNFLGNYLVAPVCVPQMVSTAAYGVGVTSGVITVLVLNTLCYCYSRWTRTEPKPPSLPPDDGEKKQQ